MNAITKVSEITVEDLADYIHITELTTDESNTLTTLKTVAENFIKSYTGQDNLDTYPDFVIVVLILVQDMWDNRTLYMDSNDLNKVVETILGMHSINLLPDLPEES